MGRQHLVGYARGPRPRTAPRTRSSPRNCPSNAFSIATQYIDAGCEIRTRAHERIEEIPFLYDGHGTLTLEGQKILVREGSTCLVGRYGTHRLDNESGRLMKVLVVAFPAGIEEGEGAFFVYGGSGRAMVHGRWSALAPETHVYVGRGAPHDIENDGVGDLSFVWVAAPPPFDVPADAASLYRHPGIASRE